jgi:hypothetical protein
MVERGQDTVGITESQRQKVSIVGAAVMHVVWIVGVVEAASGGLVIGNDIIPIIIGMAIGGSAGPVGIWVARQIEDRIIYENTSILK